ncbi:MAG TPA: isoprenylcysteine carboxylmethyltransferase family protein [Planctomycetota bacterium]|nr:isoprenylcysteine carboxylmethyltransferase family protein [Planctomycetota bacterium]
MSAALAAASGDGSVPAPARGSVGAVAVGRSLFKVRGWLYLPFAVFALLWIRWEWEDDLVLWPLGLSLMASGGWLRFAAIRRMGGAARTHKDRAKRLVTTGPYAWTRNPIYVANLTSFAGFVILCELPWFAALSVLALGAAYHAIALYEEGVLSDAFGAEYDAYRARVPMWLPRQPRSPVVEDASTLYPPGKLVRRERGALLNLGVLVVLAILKELLAQPL